MPRGAPPLVDREVHVWSLGLDPPRDRLEKLGLCLSPDEWDRAAAFRFALHRTRFVAARGQLRRILALYEGLPPDRITFVYGQHGKPGLAGSPLRFNLAHAAGEALIAVTVGSDLGIDLERVRSDCECVPLARCFFSTVESCALFAVPPEARGAAFFAIWTRKEAFVKATGGGLSIPLRDFDVSTAAAGPVRLLRTAWDPSEAARWSLCSLDAPPGFAAALAISGPARRVRRLDAHRPRRDLGQYQSDR